MSDQQSDSSQEKVSAWLKTLGFRWSQGGYWVNDRYGALAPDQAIFFYDAMVEVRKDEQYQSLRVLKKLGVIDESAMNRLVTEGYWSQGESLRKAEEQVIREDGEPRPLALTQKRRKPMSKLDLDLLAQQIRTMSLRSELYKLLKQELSLRGWWKNRKRGKPGHF